MRNEYNVLLIVDAFFAAFLFATLLYLPLLLMLIEIISVYMYLLTLFEILIIISLFVYVYVIHYFWYKSLTLKNKDHLTDIKKLFLKNMVIIDTMILILGLIAILIVIPILWV